MSKSASEPLDRPGSEHSGPCTCRKDAFAALPPELRPRVQKKSSLRQATCPGCGLVYWTNRATDLCMECERKGRTAAGL